MRANLFATSFAALISSVGLATSAHTFDLERFTFATHTYWVTLPGQVRDDSGRIIYRRYSMIRDTSNQIEGNLGFPNTMMFYCSRKNTDMIVFHLPNTAELKSFAIDAWKPEIKVNVLFGAADGRSLSTSYKGEYIKGDIFIDVNRENILNILQILASSSVVVDFGLNNDQINYEVKDVMGDGVKVNDFFRAALPMILFKSGDKRDISALGPIETSDMLERCVKYKKAGR